MTRLKILAVAYACNPMRGSEFGVGWGWASSIAKNHDVTVVTADFNQNDIEQFLNTQQIPLQYTPHFIYVKNRPWHYRPQGSWLQIESSIAKPLMNLAYQDWLRCAYEDARRELTKDRFDLVHLITYVGWRFPGKFYRLGIPFVWGPIGGLKNTPLRLLPILGVKGAIYYGARNLTNSVQLGTLQGPRQALQASRNGIIAATSEIQRELRTRFKVESRVISEVGPPFTISGVPTQRAADEPLRICWSGQHVPGKALHLLLRAAASLGQDVNYTIDILGDGPASRSWRLLASNLGIGKHCHWNGWISRHHSLEVMREGHVFIITSLKDLTSTVAVEAISLGLPVISLDHCGFSDLVTEQCGIKIHPGAAKQIVKDLATAIRGLYANESWRMELAVGAMKRSEQYSWATKMRLLNEIYRDVVFPDSAKDERRQLESTSSISRSVITQ